MSKQKKPKHTENKAAVFNPQAPAQAEPMLPTNFNEVASLLELSDYLAHVGIDFSAPFVHGVLTAFCCHSNDPEGWVGLLMPSNRGAHDHDHDHDHDDEDEAQRQSELESVFKYLRQLKNQIADTLSDNELNFDIDIGEPANLFEEVFYTREWASGYYLGLEHAGVYPFIEHDEDSVEFFKDLAPISAMPLPDEEDYLEATDAINHYTDAYDADLEEEINELDDMQKDLAEIEEYLRIGAVGLFIASYQHA